MVARMAVLEIDGLERAREQTLALVESVGDDDLERVHSTLMSPLVWDLGHIAAFEDLWLVHNRGGLPMRRPDLASVYDAFETPRARRGELRYLKRAEAERYMTEVRACVRALELPEEDAIVELVVRHERQHAETMLQTLALAQLDGWNPSGGVAAEPPGAFPLSGLEFVAVAAGAVPIGAGSAGFAYDNERPQHEVEVQGFMIGRGPVTNHDWLAFVEDGGYARRDWWSEEGWAWRNAEQIERPLRWLDAGAERRLYGIRELELEAPVVHVSWYEADAFARARGVRLPSEFEWEAAATWDPQRGEKLRWPWGDEAPDPTRANLIETALFAPRAPAVLLDGSAPSGALAMIGDVWEWTESEFRGYPGFRAHPYREYSEVFFGPHYRVLRGGSFAASREVVTPTFRNWDFPGRRQIFAGLRVAADAA